MACEKRTICAIVDATNVLFALFGVILLAVGIVGMTQYAYLAELVNRDAFKFFVAAGVFVIVTALVGIGATHLVIFSVGAEDKKKRVMGRVLLFIYFIVMLLFIVCELVGAGLWLTYSYEMETERTGNPSIDKGLSKFQDFVDRRVNCSFNYCCQKYQSTKDESINVLRTPYNYQSGKKSGGEYTNTRDKAHEYYKAHNFVSAGIEAEFQADAADATPEDQFNRTAFIQQYYDGFGDVTTTVNNDKTAAAVAGWNATRTIEELHTCKENDATEGNRCWIRWQAMCPNPLKDLTKPAWNDICSFVAEQQTWVYPDTDARKNPDDARENLLVTSMCDKPLGNGVTDINYGYKAALIWKLKSSVPLAIVMLVFALIQVGLLVMVVVTVFQFCCDKSDPKEVTVTVESNTAVEAPPGDTNDDDL